MHNFSQQRFEQKRNENHTMREIALAEAQRTPNTRLAKTNCALEICPLRIFNEELCSWFPVRRSLVLSLCCDKALGLWSLVEYETSSQ